MNLSSNITNNQQRVVFIDLLRAYAILMMVQGHFIEVTLATQYCSLDNYIYLIWATLRGMTAPIFFFASGTVFSYLLFRAEKEDGTNLRVKKGIKRFFLLVGLGYLLRLQPAVFTDLFNLKSEEMKPFWAIDTLHCIGFGILFIILIYKFGKLFKLNHSLIFTFFALVIFLISPILEKSTLILSLPIPIADFFVYQYGSNFPIIPWTGFVLWGALIGYLLAKNSIDFKNLRFSISILIIGFALILFSGEMLIGIYRITSFKVFEELYLKNILFLHLGSVLFVTGLFSYLANNFKFPISLQKVGNNTLMIYIVHIFIIYGTAFTPGINNWFSKSLNPIESITFALILIFAFIILTKYYEKIKLPK